MIKLYKQIDNEFHYWESWEKDKNTGIVHKGIVGTKGNFREVKSGFSTNFHEKIQKEIFEQTENGFRPIEPENHSRLLIEFNVDGMGTEKDVDKRNGLQSRMDETLGWTGLGFCDGGSIGSGTMEVCCFVVDFEVAKKVIENDLNGTEHSNYNRIYNEDTE
jgi:hypothetical protein